MDPILSSSIDYQSYIEKRRNGSSGAGPVVGKGYELGIRGGKSNQFDSSSYLLGSSNRIFNGRQSNLAPFESLKKSGYEKSDNYFKENPISHSWKMYTIKPLAVRDSSKIVESEATIFPMKMSKQPIVLKRYFFLWKLYIDSIIDSVDEIRKNNSIWRRRIAFKAWKTAHFLIIALEVFQCDEIC